MNTTSPSSTFSRSFRTSLGLSLVTCLGWPASALAAPPPEPSAPVTPVVPAPAPVGPVEPAPTVVVTEPPPAFTPSPEAEKPVVPLAVKDVYGKGMRIDLNEDGSRYLRLINWHQVWGRYQQLNPGSAINGKPRDGAFDIMLRRSRFLLLGQISPRFKILTHLGINNQTFNNDRKPAFFIHEAVGEFEVLPKNMMYIGAGLHFVNGISRMTGASTISFMGMDAPILNWPVIELTDQFARKLGVYARGMFGRFDYRLAVNRPFLPKAGTLALDPAVDAMGTPISGAVNQAADVTLYNPKMNTFEVTGYFNWQFFDKEIGPLPYYAGTYIGEKKVFNVGAGFAYHPGAMAAYTRAYAADEDDEDKPEVKDGKPAALASSFKQYPFVAVSADVFADLPLGKDASKGALSVYGVFYHYDYGPNYVRQLGIANIAAADAASKVATVNGPGNNYPAMGTGEHIFVQAGYVLPFKVGLQKFMPYADMQVSMMKGLDQPSNIFGAGINWFILGHYAKLTLHYRNRPVFMVDTDGQRTVDSRASEVILQGQVAF